MNNSLINISISSAFFEDYEKGQPCENVNLESRNIIAAKSSCYFYNCNFIKSTKCSIFFSQSYQSYSSKLFVELCSFHGITNDQIGGAIYFGSYDQCCILSSCGYKCKSNTRGQFCYVIVGNANKNHLIDSTIIFTLNGDGDYAFDYSFGNVTCYGVNVSYNKVRRVSTFMLFNPSKSSISFCSFAKNNATIEWCFYCQSGSNPHEMTSTNIIKNSQENPKSGLIYTTTYAKLIMTSCNVIGNSENQKGTVFYPITGSISCMNCFIPQDQQTYVGTVTFGTIETMIMNIYDFLLLKNCIEAKKSTSWYQFDNVYSPFYILRQAIKYVLFLLSFSQK